MIDLHCHIDLYANPYEVVRRCREDNIYVLSVTTTPKAWEGTSALARDWKPVAVLVLETLWLALLMLGLLQIGR